MQYLRYALWAMAAGAFIPVMAVLNARLGRSLGEPLQAVFILFAVGFVVSGVACLLLTGSLPSVRALTQIPFVNLSGGLIVAFYVLSVTLLAPRFGIGNAILFVMVAQIFTSTAIDHFGMFGAIVRPVSLLRAGGLAVLLLGLVISQVAAQKAIVN
jgi:transporter family-2 protein